MTRDDKDRALAEMMGWKLGYIAGDGIFVPDPDRYPEHNRFCVFENGLRIKTSMPSDFTPTDPRTGWNDIFNHVWPTLSDHQKAKVETFFEDREDTPFLLDRTPLELVDAILTVIGGK